MTEICLLETIEYLVMTFLFYICKTKRAMTLRFREYQANCRNQQQRLAVVHHSAIGHL